MAMARSAVLSITEAAAARVRQLLAKSGKPALGIRVGVKTGGCSGLMYQVEYAHERQGFEEVVEDKGIKVFVDPTALMYLIGAEMDYRESKFESGFVFNNPNEIDRCGCGESFRI
jgi:iron-sulfur cluster assembly protein